MARSIGRTKAWIWGLLGAFCALLFGPRADAGELGQAVALYGVRPVRPPERPPGEPADRERAKPLTEEERAEIETLLDRYLAGELAGVEEPTEEEAARIAGLVKQLGAEDFGAREKAQEALAEFGAKAIPALREAAKSGDAEVADRAERLLAKLGDPEEKAVREAFAKFGGRAGSVVYGRVSRLRREAALAAAKAARAEKEGEEEQAGALRREQGEKNTQAGRLAALARKLGLAPVLISPGGKYGVRPPPQIRYGVRVRDADRLRETE